MISIPAETTRLVDSASSDLRTIQTATSAGFGTEISLHRALKASTQVRRQMADIERQIKAALAEAKRAHREGRAA